MTRKTRKDKFYRLDIIGEHELKVRECKDGTMQGRCSCGAFEQMVEQYNLMAYERMTDAFLKHVRSVNEYEWMKRMNR